MGFTTMKKVIWQVWVENYTTSEKNQVMDETILFQGSKTEAYKFYKKNKQIYSELHVGYLLPE